MHHPIAARGLVLLLYFVVFMPILASWMGRRLKRIGDSYPKVPKRP